MTFFDVSQDKWQFAVTDLDVESHVDINRYTLSTTIDQWKEADLCVIYCGKSNAHHDIDIRITRIVRVNASK